MNPANFEKAQSCHSGPRRRARKVHALVAAAQKKKATEPLNAADRGTRPKHWVLNSVQDDALAGATATHGALPSKHMNTDLLVSLQEASRECVACAV
jgi:hypothetical protein